MDLAQFDLKEAADRGISVDILHPVTGEVLEQDGKKITIKVLGKDSGKWQQVTKRQQARNANKYRNGRVPDSETEKNLIEIIAECTVSWTNIEFNDSQLKCTKDNAAMLYEKRSWIAEQVLGAAADRGNYFLE